MEQLCFDIHDIFCTHRQTRSSIPLGFLCAQRQKWEYTFSTEEKQYLSEIRAETERERAAADVAKRRRLDSARQRRKAIRAKEERKLEFYQAAVAAAATAVATGPPPPPPTDAHASLPTRFGRD